MDVRADPVLHVRGQRDARPDASLAELAEGDPDAAHRLETVFSLLLKRAEELARDA